VDIVKITVMRRNKMNNNLNLDDRGGRIYNGLPSDLMNKLYDGLVDRYGSIDELTDAVPNWATFSLYLARTCGVIERRKNDLS
jgi:hypothetical protein